jgi:hypothetical protein
MSNIRFVIITLLSGMLALLACEKEKAQPAETCLDACPHEGFHAVFLKNGECFNSVNSKFRFDGGDIALRFRNGNLINESLLIYINPNYDFEDTLWLESFYLLNPQPSKAYVLYSYVQDDQVFAGWTIPAGKSTKEDYLIIDYFNEDTTIIEGRFQCRFQESWNGGAIEIPDSLVITCGSFRVQKR